jgi:hypothetical protein
MSREHRIIEILKKEPGISGYQIQRRLVGQYRFKWIGEICEFGRLHISLYRLECNGCVIGRWAKGPYPRTRLYYND